MARLSAMLFFLFYISTCFSMENVVYLIRSDPAINSITALIQSGHSIPIIISQAYRIDQKGRLLGDINPLLFTFAYSHHIKFMPLITNKGFDKNIAHQFLTSTTAQQNALASILAICKKNHFYGVQFDFESIPVKDKKILTHFYEVAAAFLHKNNFQVSFAIMPVVSDGPFRTDFQKAQYDNFSGAFDLKALGSSADFVTLMAYDQHIGKVTPGPIAGLPWVEKVIQHTLKSIPAHKISLGIPVYSGFWYTGRNPISKSISIQNNAVEYSLVKRLMTKYQLHLNWDSYNKVNYAMYDYDWLNKYLFIENAKSFAAKLALVKKYQLRGISIFRLGAEDPAIWRISF